MCALQGLRASFVTPPVSWLRRLPEVVIATPPPGPLTMVQRQSRRQFQWSLRRPPAWAAPASRGAARRRTSVGKGIRSSAINRKARQVHASRDGRPADPFSLRTGDGFRNPPLSACGPNQQNGSGQYQSRRCPHKTFSTRTTAYAVLDDRLKVARDDSLTHGRSAGEGECDPVVGDEGCA